MASASSRCSMTSARTTASKRRCSTARRSVKNSPRRPWRANIRVASSMAVSSTSTPATVVPPCAKRASSAPSPQPISRMVRLVAHWRATHAMRARVYGQPSIGWSDASRQWYARRSRYFANVGATPSARDPVGSEPGVPMVPEQTLGLREVLERVDVHHGRRHRQRARLGAEHRAMRAEHRGAEDVDGAVLHVRRSEVLPANGHGYVAKDTVRITIFVDVKLLESVEAARHLGH